LTIACKPYRAPAWLPGGHAQTIWPLLIKPRPLTLRRERWDTPDGDFIDIDFLDGPPGRAAACPLPRPRRQFAQPLRDRRRTRCRAAGWRFALPHFRGCSGELNRRPRAYHSGDSGEIDWILRRLLAADRGRPLCAAGVSLGGNALLKWAGERGPAAAERRHRRRRHLRAARPGRLRPPPGARLQPRLHPAFPGDDEGEAGGRLRCFPGLFDEARMLRAANLYEFDDAVTAPLHGFAGTDDYWRRCSAKPWLAAISVPALAVNPKNDPFLPAACLPGAADVGAAVRLEHPAAGGHVGFVSGAFPGNLDWLPQRLLHFFLHETS
jgi:predicted alpha/beta-fold hydrolase